MSNIMPYNSTSQAVSGGTLYSVAGGRGSFLRSKAAAQPGIFAGKSKGGPLLAFHTVYLKVI